MDTIGRNLRGYVSSLFATMMKDLRQAFMKERDLLTHSVGGRRFKDAEPASAQFQGGLPRLRHIIQKRRYQRDRSPPSLLRAHLY